MSTLNREEIAEQHKWRLEDIFEDEKEWAATLKKCEHLLDALKLKKGTYTTTAKDLLDYLKQTDEIDLMVEKVFSYAYLKKDEDTSDSKRQELKEKLTPLAMLNSSVNAAFVTEFMRLEKETIERYYQEEEGLLFYKKYFDDLLRSGEHILSAKEEEIIAKTRLMDSASNIFGMLTNADMVFPKVHNEAGEEVELTQSNYIQFMESPNREVRKEAFQALYATYRQFINTCAATLSGSIKADVFRSTVRNYNSSLEAALFPKDVPVEVYENLISTVKNNTEPLKKYMSLRKKALGVDELHMYDLYNPLVNDFDMKITYEEAFETMKKALAVLGEEYISILDKAKNERWIDVYENKGKRSGAYVSGPYGVHPYVLLNHKDNLNSLFTLAHECGHMCHSHYSDTNNPLLYAQYTIFVAEVASTVNEVLLMNYLLENTTDKEMRKYLLQNWIDDMRATIFRQTKFAEFEKVTHEMAEQGQPLTADSLNNLYYKLNQEYYGTDITHDKEIECEWARIPHFYTNFYVFQYATGYSAAIAIAKQILEEGEPAVKRYIEFLKSGGRDYPINQLKQVGVDLSTPQPIEEAMKVFDGLVTELEGLLTE